MVASHVGRLDPSGGRTVMPDASTANGPIRRRSSVIHPRLPWVLAGSCLALGGSGCASRFDESAQWRNAVVREVLDYSQVPADVDRRCVDGRPEAQGQAVAILGYRVGRGLYLHAVPVDPSMQLHPGERVAVHPSLCRVKLIGSA
jgi:hypothetical protein